MRVDEAIAAVKRNSSHAGELIDDNYIATEVASVLVDEVEELEAALADREPEHKAWEWWARHPSCKIYYSLRENKFSTQEDGPWVETPLAAVLAAKAAEGIERKSSPMTLNSQGQLTEWCP